MNAKVPVKITEIAEKDAPTIPGTPFAGGFYTGRIWMNGERHIVVSAPKALGYFKAPYGERGVDHGAHSFNDGMANTIAMAAAGSVTAKKILGLVINDCDDWCFPARDQRELQYRNLKPTADENWCFSGDNPSSIPPGYPYSQTVPGQALAEEFRKGGSEAFETGWHSSSTQYSAYEAWGQHFEDGDAGYDDKFGEFWVRVVRTIRIVSN